MRARSFAITLTCALFAAMLSGCADDASDTEDTGMSEAALSNNEQTAFNYFVAKGLTKVQAAGIVGNLIQESSVIPTAVEYGGGPGRGIAQWSVGGRWDTSTTTTSPGTRAQHGASRWALNTQLDFIWYELTTFSGYGLASLQAATTVTGRDDRVPGQVRDLRHVRRRPQRISYAKQVLAAYGGGGDAAADAAPAATRARSASEMPDNACVQSKFDDLWYQCANGIVGRSLDRSRRVQRRPPAVVGEC